MRYQCPDCRAWVKDKFILGLLHVCSASPPNYHMNPNQPISTFTPKGKALLRQQHDIHNVAAPHDKDTCEVCKQYV